MLFLNKDARPFVVEKAITGTTVSSINTIAARILTVQLLQSPVQAPLAGQEQEAPGAGSLSGGVCRCATQKMAS